MIFASLTLAPAQECLTDSPVLPIDSGEKNYGHSLQHLHNELCRQLHQDKSNVFRINELLIQLKNHLSNRFDHEEQEMLAVNYPYTTTHRHQHQRALENITHQINYWKKKHNKSVLRDFLKNTLTQWINTHSRADIVAELFITHIKEAE